MKAVKAIDNYSTIYEQAIFNKIINSIEKPRFSGLFCNKFP